MKEVTPKKDSCHRIINYMTIETKQNHGDSKWEKIKTNKQKTGQGLPSVKEAKGGMDERVEHKRLLQLRNFYMVL